MKCHCCHSAYAEVDHDGRSYCVECAIKTATEEELEHVTKFLEDCAEHVPAWAAPGCSYAARLTNARLHYLRTGESITNKETLLKWQAELEP